MNFVDRFILHLSLIPGVGVETIRHLVTLLEKYSIEDIYTFSSSCLAKATHFSEKKANVIVQGLANKLLLEKEEDLIQKSQACYISLCNSDYPALLSEIHSPPPILYYKGHHFSRYKNRSAIAIVGSRQGNYYAEQVVNHFVPELVKHNVCIVSGGALGVDSMAHKATIQAHGDTMVILGSGLLHLYPYQNKTLFDAVIQKNGTVISCFSMDTKPLAHNFPARNRIISGMTSATVIVQAAAKSGAYITAQCALDQGKEVFAVPGNIFEPLSAGCHALLSQGAQLADSVHTILQHTVPHEFVEIKQTSLWHQDSQDFPLISSIADTILYQCAKPMFLEELSELIDTIDIAVLQKEICSLQLKGKLKQDVSGAFVTVRL